MFPKLRLAMRFIRAISDLTLELRDLKETLVATTILLNIKPISLDRVFSLDKNEITSPLLRDLISSRTEHTQTEIVDFKDNEALAQDSEAKTIDEAKRRFEEQRFQAWRGTQDERIL